MTNSVVKEQPIDRGTAKQRHGAVWVLGVNSAYHESSACILRDGELVAAVEEERFNRIRHGKVADLTNPHWLPEQSIRYCLDAAGIGPEELSLVGYSFDPARRQAHNVGLDVETVEGGPGTAQRESEFCALLEQVPSLLSKYLNEDLRSRFRWVQHHLCHASSAFYASPLRGSGHPEHRRHFAARQK